MKGTNSLKGTTCQNAHKQKWKIWIRLSLSKKSKNISRQKVPGPDKFTGKFTKKFKKIKAEGIFPNLFYVVSITLLWKQEVGEREKQASGGAGNPMRVSTPGTRIMTWAEVAKQMLSDWATQMSQSTFLY